ncbi:MAG: GatB/YqeY domain-containing protein [Planctomycetota bacterium]|nr:GatB/YqeY domain-containing protein [Planctomycetota bacterium]
MSVRDDIQAEVKAAMRSGDTVTRDTLRMCIAAFENRRIELGRGLEEPELIQVLAKAVKSRQDSVAHFDNAGRTELADKERAEIDVIERYLPEQMSVADLRSLVEATIAEVGASSPKDIGQVMKAIMAKHRGQVDGKAVQQLAGELLGQA